LTTYRFPEGFVWGAATSAYQVEGSPLADGARPSIQHRYSHTPGNCQDGVTGDRLAGHYERWAEDVALMEELGMQHYEYSMAWPRVLPEGTGLPNPKGLAFYDRLTDALLEAGITPTPILHVWDLPGDLHDRGGWANRDVAGWFGDYAAVLFDLIGDRASHWYTICEPSSLAWGGYLSGVIAPAMKDLYAAIRAAHHINLAHGRAVQAFRASGAAGVIGTATNVSHVRPASDREEDVLAAGRVSDFENEIFLDPLFLGSYPEGLAEWFGDAWPPVQDGDLATISEPVDFLGITYAPGAVVSASPDPAAEDDPRSRLLDAHIADPGYPTTSIGWPNWPDGMVTVLRKLKDRYGDRPMVVTRGRRGLHRRHCPRRNHRRPGAHRVPPGSHDRGASGDRGRHRPPRLLRVVTARHLGVLAWRAGPVRPDLRRLRDPAAHDKGIRPMVRRGHGKQRVRRPVTETDRSLSHRGILAAQVADRGASTTEELGLERLV
jgi:beta-glucosidase